MAAKKKKTAFSLALTVFLCIVCLVVGVIAGFVGYAILTAPKGEEPLPTASTVGGDIQIHFPELGYAAGDCIYIKAGDTDILIDAGPKTSSVSMIADYLNQYVTDNTLEYVIVTHAHQDHYAAFSADTSIFDLFECETIIGFAMTNQSATATMYNNYLDELDDEIAAGATFYSAADCISRNRNIFTLSEGITLEILDSYYYTHTSSSENNYSVCCLLSQGDRHYLFTGDLEDDGEEKLVEMNTLPTVDFYKAGHHGSKTSSTTALLEVIRPSLVCVPCCAGTSEYTDTAANQFPTQDFIDRIAPYTDRVYIPSVVLDDEAKTYESMNGILIVCGDADRVWIVCSASDTPLKDSAWFTANRTCPTAWAN